jgi:DNA transposition AAA+ family ATPase
MHEDDGFLSAYSEALELQRAARPDQVAEALRLLACEVAYCARYSECLPLDELSARIAEADKDAAGIALVAEGMAHLVEVLRRLHVTPSASRS